MPVAFSSFSTPEKLAIKPPKTPKKANKLITPATITAIKVGQKMRQKEIFIRLSITGSMNKNNQPYLDKAKRLILLKKLVTI
jgi:hypothetical protein